MTSKELVSHLKSQSTWRLVLLSLITLGVYTAHYIKRQTRIINEQLDKKRQIPEVLVATILVLSYVSIILLIPNIMVEEGHPITKICGLLDKLWSLFIIIWAFNARNRMNQLLAVNKGQPHWFHGFWTFLFSPFYFNFKINRLNDDFAKPSDEAILDNDKRQT